MQQLIEIVGAIVVGAFVLLGIGVLMAVPTYYLWNWLMPTLFGFTQITLLQAWGLNILTGIFFKRYTPSK